MQVNDICVIVVAFHPDEKFFSRMANSISQFNHAIIVDNGGLALSKQEILTLEKTTNLYFIKNEQNFGLGKALNQGLEYAINLNHKAVYLLDQDSELYSKGLVNLLYVFNQIEQSQLIGVLGTNYHSVKNSNDVSAGYIEKKSVITSGSLITLDVIQKVGFFRDDYFIDYIDIEFSLRLRSKGYKVYRTNQILMHHNVGFPKKHRLLFKSFISTNHSALRRYYIARNHLLMMKQYNYFFSKNKYYWLIKTIKRSVFFIFIVVMFEEQKKEKVSYIVLGLYDGFRAKTGIFLKSIKF